jgi:hypothetical protein
MRNFADKRFWLYSGMIVVVAVFMVVSFALPWWSVRISEVPFTDAVIIYGYGLRHHLVELRPYVIEDETPLYETVLAWLYIALSVALMLLSAWVKDLKGRLLLGSVGLLYIVYAIVAIFVVTANRIADFNIALVGQSSMIYHYVVDVVVGYNARFGWGYYLACITGFMCIILALFRNSILGTHKFG